MEENADRQPQGHAPKKWAYPKHLRRNDRDNESEEPQTKAVLCTVSAADASAICARLESNGVACDARLEGTDVLTGPHAFAEILVAEVDMTLARRLCEGEEQDADQGDESFEDDVAEIQAENWICPKCRKRTLELLPLSSGRRLLRNYCLAILIIPLAIAIFLMAAPLPAVEDFLQPMGIPCAIAGVVSALILIWQIVSRREQKYCTVCDWRYGGASKSGK